MKAIIQSLLGITTFIFVSVPFVSAETIFSDIKDSPYKESIEYLYGRGIVQGYGDGNFGPNNSLNRAEMTKIILGAMVDAKDMGDEVNCFHDVRSAWYAKYVCYAKKKDIVKGYDDRFFRPAQEVNMVEGLKIALESFSVSLKQGGDKWYEPYTEFAHHNNLLSKYDYFPATSMTRGQMAYLTHQLILNKQGTKEFTGVRKNWSAGCGKTPPSFPPISSTVGGKKRDYITVIPNNYNKDKPKKLIFAFHGRTNPNTMVRTYYKVEQASESEAIMIYPAGLPTGTSSRGWSDGGDAPDKLRDYFLFDQLLEEFGDNYCVDLDEVYVVGHSLGAWFTNSLACFRGNVIRGVGSLGGGTTVGNCTGPVATMIWHNPKDRLVPIGQGITALNQYLKQNQCHSTHRFPVSPSGGNCQQYEGCYDHAPVVWCPHEVNYDHRGTYYPHTWPKFTGQGIWDFFKSLKE